MRSEMNGLTDSTGPLGLEPVGAAAFEVGWPGETTGPGFDGGEALGLGEVPALGLGEVPALGLGEGATLGLGEGATLELGAGATLGLGVGLTLALGAVGGTLALGEGLGLAFGTGVALGFVAVLALEETTPALAPGACGMAAELTTSAAASMRHTLPRTDWRRIANVVQRLLYNECGDRKRKEKKETTSDTSKPTED